jgi:type II secretory pathway pseudopilin PulG
LSTVERRRGMSYVELLAAVLILSVVAGGAVATWSLSSRTPANKRVTDMASIIATGEIEAVKAKKYMNLADATTTTYYTKNGVPTTVVAERVYLATTVISTAVNRDASTNTEDLVQVQCTVTNAAATKTYDIQRTLIAFGGF